MTFTNGLTLEERQRYHADRDAAILSEAHAAAFRDTWEDRLHALGLDLLGRPVPDEEDLPIWGNGPAAAPQNSPAPPVRSGVPGSASDSEPDLEWDALGVVEPQALPPESIAVDVVEFIAGGENDDEEEWLVNGLIPKHGLTILGGNPKSGKTLLVLDLCFAVATGREFFGRETSEAAFLFVTEEGAPAEMRRRMRRLVSSGGLPKLPGRVIYRQGVRFDDPRSWESVREELGRLAQPTLLVLDPLRDLLTGDENDSNTLATVNRSIHAILRDFPGVTVVLLHHLAKRTQGDGGQRLRGSTALWATADCTLILEAEQIPHDLPEGGEVPLKGSVSVEPRNAQRGRFFWRWDAETGLFLESSADARTLADKVVVFLAEHGPTTTKALSSAFDATTDVIRHSLARDSRLSSQPGAGPNDPSLWSLAE